MANFLKYTGFSTNKVVSPTSRYNNKKIVYYGDKAKITFATYKKQNLSFGPKDKFYEITKDVEFRPDLVSYYAYGISDYWWRIMEMNGMKDILEFRAGKNIRLPQSFLM